MQEEQYFESIVAIPDNIYRSTGVDSYSLQTSIGAERAWTTKSRAIAFRLNLALIGRISPIENLCRGGVGL